MMTASTMETASEFSVTPEKSPSSLTIVPFGFHAKTSYDADETLLQIRSEHFKISPDKKDRDIWNRPPPDFRYMVYDPKPTKRNTADAMRPWDYGTIPGQRDVIMRNRGEIRLPRIFDQKEREPEIITGFHIDRPFTAKKKFVSQGMYKPGYYNDAKRHDFRQYPPLKKLGLDEFLTSHDKDPFNLHFRSKHLNHIHGLPSGPPERDLVLGRQMAPPMSAKKRWDARLFIENNKWPQKNEAFTRHRRRHRQPYSAFMERVQDDLTTQWYRERLDHVLQS